MSDELIELIKQALPGVHVADKRDDETAAEFIARVVREGEAS